MFYLRLINYRDLNDGIIKNMCFAMKHRGPNDQDIYISKENVTVGLGHRRLNIIDLSASGRHPMSNEDKSIWIVCNGEVYNYHELRSELTAKGHIFSSNTDMETIIHLYEEYGENCVKYCAACLLSQSRIKISKSPLLARHRGKEKAVTLFIF